jgi:hypothetical protein
MDKLSNRFHKDQSTAEPLLAGYHQSCILLQGLDASGLAVHPFRVDEIVVRLL